MPRPSKLFALTLTSKGVSHRFNRRLSEWHLALVMLAGGIMLAQGDTFTLPPYEAIRHYVDQSTWSVAMIAIGGARLAVLVVNGAAQRCTTHLRYVLASVSGFVWALLLGGFLSHETPLMIGPFLGVAVLVEMISAYRAAQDAHDADEIGARGSGVGDVGGIPR